MSHTGKCSVEYLAGGHSVYSPEELDVKLTHTPPKTTTDKAAYYSTWLLRKGFDAATLWNIGELTQKKIMLRAIFLETIAVAMLRPFDTFPPPSPARVKRRLVNCARVIHRSNY